MEELIPEYYKASVWKKPMSVYDDIPSSTDVEKDQQRQQGVKILTPLLTAAKNGVREMVRKILEDVPLAIHETTADMKNILLVAAESKQQHIFSELKNHHAWDNLIQAVDDQGDNVLHLAAKSPPQSYWTMRNPALQMQWETKWFRYVFGHVPRSLIFQTNLKNETPLEAFFENHGTLATEVSNWLKDTLDYYSVVAVLVAGALFTTSSNVAGGFNDQTGEPTLLRDPKFSGFAIISMAGLCFSITSLVTFLVARTSRHRVRDFETALPVTLFIGIGFLYWSIVCMLGSFSASAFMLLQGRMSKAMSLIYVACLPMLYYMVLQLPVYWDLFKAIWRGTSLPNT